MKAMRSRPADGHDLAVDSLRRALDAEGPAEKNYHLRTALQHLVIEADTTGE